MEIFAKPGDIMLNIGGLNGQYLNGERNNEWTVKKITTRLSATAVTTPASIKASVVSALANISVTGNFRLVFSRMPLKEPLIVHLKRLLILLRPAGFNKQKIA